MVAPSTQIIIWRNSVEKFIQKFSTDFFDSLKSIFVTLLEQIKLLKNDLAFLLRHKAFANYSLSKYNYHYQ